MGVVNTSYTFTATDTITSAKMNNIIDDTIMTSTAVSGSTLQVTPSGQLSVNSQGITSNELAASSVTQTKIGTNVAGSGPAFKANATTETYVAQSTFAKIALATEEFDTNSNFASSRFTPTIAGYYFISGCVAFVGTGVTNILSGIAKNGSISSPQSLGSGQTDGIAVRSNVSDIIYLNGSSDYVELCGYNTKPGGANTSGNGQTFFVGCLIRSA